MFTLNGASINISSLQIDCSVTRTGGYFIDMTTSCSRITLSDLNLVAPMYGIHIPANSALIQLREIDVGNTVDTSIIIDGGFAVSLDCVTCRNSPFGNSHLQINHVEDIIITGCNFLETQSPMNIVPGSGQYLGEMLCVNTHFDQPQTGNGIRVAPSGSGIVNKMFVANCWSTANGNNYVIFLSNGGGGTINGVSFLNCIFAGNGGAATNGILMNGVSNVSVMNCRIGSQVTAVSINSCSNVQLIGNHIGPSDGMLGNGTGIFIGGSSDYCVITNNDLSGNTTPINYAASGTHNLIGSNVGNPVTMAGITVGASPFTYRAGPGPETVFINAGTVSNIEIDGVSVLIDSNHAIALRPNQVLRVTYSAAPFMVKAVN